MFDRRLKILLIVFSLAGLVIVGRLVHLQVINAGYYRKRAEQSLRLKPKQLPFVRGSVVDRTGEVLVADEPGWDLCIDFVALAADIEEKGPPAKDVKERKPNAIDRALGTWRKRYRGRTANKDEAERAFRDEMDITWREITFLFSTEAEPLSTEILRDRARVIVDRVQRIRRAVERRRGFNSRVLEETIPHAIVTGLDPQGLIKAHDLLPDFPWIHVVASSVRTYVDYGTPFAHVLGRLGRVSAETVAEDPMADEPLAKYLADEHVGISGVEWAAERTLRGRRGQITRDRRGEIIEDIPALNGQDVTVALHAALQRRLYGLLGTTVDQVPESSGGAIVVLDVASREVLALVSYPSYDPNRFNELYDSLRDDTVSLPLRFRALANQYAPGSTVKPITCLVGLDTGRIELDTRIECTGYLFPNDRDHWRCWQVHGTSMRKAHGSIDVVGALTGSCNVFMYKVGEMVGVDALCSAFDMMGIGKDPHIGLDEAAWGINPTPSWLASRNSPVYPAHARNFAIGQGEILVTPIQMANLMATYASGRYRWVRLIRGGEPSPEWNLPFKPEHWAAVRQGIYGVVNDPDGTAYKTARLVDDHIALCGKTGSATARPWTTSYRIPYLDAGGQEQVTVVPAGIKKHAIDQFTLEHPLATFDPEDIVAASHWPLVKLPEGQEYSHAWFGGYLQRLGPDRQPDWSAEPRIAIAVLVEFGGSGGRTSGPLAKQVAMELIDLFGPDLDFDAPTRPTVSP